MSGAARRYGEGVRGGVLDREDQCTARIFHPSLSRVKTINSAPWESMVLPRDSPCVTLVDVAHATSPSTTTRIAPLSLDTALANRISPRMCPDRYSARVSMPPPSTIRASALSKSSTVTLSPAASAEWKVSTVVATAAESAESVCAVHEEKMPTTKTVAKTQFRRRRMSMLPKFAVPKNTRTRTHTHR